MCVCVCVCVCKARIPCWDVLLCSFPGVLLCVNTHMHMFIQQFLCISLCFQTDCLPMKHTEHSCISRFSLSNVWWFVPVCLVLKVTSQWPLVKQVGGEKPMALLFYLHEALISAWPDKLTSNTRCNHWLCYGVQQNCFSLFAVMKCCYYNSDQKDCYHGWGLLFFCGQSSNIE